MLTVLDIPRTGMVGSRKSSTVEQIIKSHMMVGTTQRKRFPVKKSLTLVALATAASFATDIKYGVNLEALLGMPSIDQSGVDATIGFGGNIGVGARIGVMDKFSVRPAVGFEYITHGSEVGDYTTDISSQFLTIGCGLEYTVIPNLFVALTPEFDLSLGGTVEAKTPEIRIGTIVVPGGTAEGDIKNEDSPILVGLGLGYNINENIVVTAGYKLALTEYVDKYKLNKISIGGRYEF